MSRVLKMPRPALKPDAVYYADNGRAICLRCAGMSAKWTGRDISGQRVVRMTVECVAYFIKEFGSCECEMGCTTLSTVAGPDGWPLAKGGAS